MPRKFGGREWAPSDDFPVKSYDPFTDIGGDKGSDESGPQRGRQLAVVRKHGSPAAATTRTFFVHRKVKLMNRRTALVSTNGSRG
jgi:hypothetical protein